MSDRPNKRTQNPEKSAVSAVEIARDMLCELSGPRGWNDTRESWLARGARRAGLSLRRARAIFYQEPIRLEADEYLGIERNWKAATQSVETISHLAREANGRASDRNGSGSEAAEGEGRHAVAPARRRPATPPAARG
jgi:hypothetical protein